MNCTNIFQVLTNRSQRKNAIKAEKGCEAEKGAKNGARNKGPVESGGREREGESEGGGGVGESGLRIMELH